jgi:hypothetical protein
MSRAEARTLAKLRGAVHFAALGEDAHLLLARLSGGRRSPSRGSAQARR